MTINCFCMPHQVLLHIHQIHRVVHFYYFLWTFKTLLDFWGLKNMPIELMAVNPLLWTQFAIDFIGSSFIPSVNVKLSDKCFSFYQKDTNHMPFEKLLHIWIMISRCIVKGAWTTWLSIHLLNFRTIGELSTHILRLWHFAWSYDKMTYDKMTYATWKHLHGAASIKDTFLLHDDVIKCKHFPRYWPFVWGIHRSPVNSPHKVQWRGALMFSFICVWINGWVNNRVAGDFRRYRAHYDITVMFI